jgi:Ras-related protein Rab-1A
MSKLPIIEELLSNLLSEAPEVSAALVIDLDGLIIAKKSVKDFDDELIGGIMTLLDQTLKRIKRYTKTELASGSFVMDDFRLFYLELGKQSNALFVLIGNPYSNLDLYLPYSHIIANQVSLILNDQNPYCEIPELNQNKELVLKPNSRNILFIGSENVGKTAIIARYLRDEFIDKYHPTIGISIFEKDVQVANHLNLSLNLFDLSGLNSFGKVRSYYYKYSHVILVIFDYSNIESFENLQVWIQEAQKFVPKDVPFLIIGNKTDLAEEREDIKAKALALTNDHDFPFFETSALTSEGINDLFDYLIMDEFLDHDIQITTKKNDSVKIEDLSHDEKIVFVCQVDCDSINNLNIPNIIEKNIVRNISKFKELSLAVLLDKLEPVGKALNRIIDRELALKILQKYIQKGNIEKHHLNSEKDLQKFKVSNIIKQSNIT